MRRGLLKKPERRVRGRQGPPERWLAPGDIRELYQRRIGLLVRRGDPRHLLIREDLAREDIQVLDVQLEPMGEFQGSPGASRQGRRIDLDPPGFLSLATSYATAIPIGATSTATPAPARGRKAWVSIGLCPQTAMTETTVMLQDVTAGRRCRSAHARCMDAQSIVAAGDHANWPLSMRGFGGGLSPRREPQKRQATLRRSATVSPSGSMSTDSSRVMARSR